MTSKKLQRTVTAAIELDREIAEKQEQLKVLKSQLVAAARAQPEAGHKTDKGGRSVAFEADDGSIARVHLPVSQLKAKMKSDSKAMVKLHELLGENFVRLFARVTSYSLRPEFKTKAKALLEADASKIIKLCSDKASPSVSFETKEVA